MFKDANLYLFFLTPEVFKRTQDWDFKNACFIWAHACHFTLILVLN